MSTLLEEVYACTKCEKTRLPFVRSSSAGRAFRFPPTIGASGTAPLLFVGINPRVSDSNRVDLHELLMTDFNSFTELANNRYRSRPYIGQRGPEPHYAVHLRIASQLFPAQPFQAIAAATELFFCASANSDGLPLGFSTCADHYFERVLSVIQPRVVFAIGRPPTIYLSKRYGRKDGDIFVTWQHGQGARVIEIPHPASFAVEKIYKWNKAAETARGWLSEESASAIEHP